ncbi:MAG: hypothetical protein M1401_18940 [Chloroflexi bacterium]|nr:hypothetical protein [Chloroflexota bacterium]MCL5110896.1 hypothetical protein [Chloroflexota bacterium]
MMRLPGAECAGQRVPALVQPPDVLPTLLEFLEVPVPKNIHGRSLWPLIEGQAERVHDFAFSGRWAEPLSSMTLYAKSGQAFDGWAGSSTATDPLTVTDERWALVCAPSGQASELFDLERDPEQLHNVLGSKPDVATRMRRALLSFLENAEAKPDRVAPFRDGPLSGKRGGPAIAYHTRLFFLRDKEDRLIAYASQAERDRNVAPAWGTRPAGESTFGDLAEREPEALIYLEMQFYDIHDLTSELAKRAAA